MRGPPADGDGCAVGAGRQRRGQSVSQGERRVTAASAAYVNKAVEPTASSVRSFLASAFGSSSPLALGLSPQIQGKCKSTLNLDHDGIWQCAESALKPHGREGTETLHIRYSVLFKEGQAW